MPFVFERFCSPVWMPQVYLCVHFLPLSCTLETPEIPSGFVAAVPCGQEEMPVNKHSASQIRVYGSDRVQYLFSTWHLKQMSGKWWQEDFYTSLKNQTNKTSTLYPRKETKIASMLVNKRLYGFYLSWYTDKIYSLTYQGVVLIQQVQKLTGKIKWNQKLQSFRKSGRALLKFVYPCYPFFHSIMQIKTGISSDYCCLYFIHNV